MLIFLINIGYLLWAATLWSNILGKTYNICLS